MSEGKELKLILRGLDCANCANKIETKVNEYEEVEEAQLIFAKSLLKIKLKSEQYLLEVEQKVIKLVKELEPHVEVIRLQKVNLKSNKLNQKNINIKNNSNDSCCEKDNCCGKINNKNQENDGNCGETDCQCGKSEETLEEKESNKIKNIKEFILKNYQLLIGSILLLIALMIENNNISTVLYILSYIVIGKNVILKAFRNIKNGEVFDENFLMSVATLGAMIIGEYTEGIAVLLLYEIGEIFQSYAVGKSRKSISDLMNIRPDHANLIRGNREVLVSPEEVEIEDIILVKPGEKVPLDGVVEEGASFVDTSALTGESNPRKFEENDFILAGYINTNGLLKIRVKKSFEESTVSKILELVENASSKKAKTEKFITRFAKVYTPIVVLLAVVLAFVPPMFLGMDQLSDWVYKALTFLVVSCPCALVISVPLGMFAGIGGASRKGVLVKGGNYLEALKDIDTIVFDKTGTLTKGVFKVTEIYSDKILKEELLELAAIGESKSNHPIAKSVLKAFGKNIIDDRISEYNEISGHGIKVKIDENEVLLGNSKLMIKNKIKYKEVLSIGTVIHVAKEKEYLGYIVISDEIKDNAKEVIKNLKNIGIKNTIMLTGDRESIANSISKELGIDKCYSELLPNEKVEKLEELLNKNKVAFVGDGINDAPVLARADVGIAMGAIGSDAAIEAADVVLMNDELNSIIKAINSAKKTNRILWQNIIFALGIKIIVLILGAFGEASMWQAIFADVGVTILAIFNSWRCLK